MKNDLIQTASERVILGDGALGGYLYDCGISREKNLDLLNLQSSDTVLHAHQEYIRAGSQLIETNTFGANRFKLADTGFAEKVFELNLAGADIARTAAGTSSFVAGSVGPSGLRFPLVDQQVSLDEIKESFREQFRGLAQGGVDAFIIETFTCLAEMEIALAMAAETAPEVPVIAQMVFPTGQTTASGDAIEDCTRAMINGGARMIGTNCGRGVHTASLAIKKLAAIVPDDILLSVFPNAGLPELVGDRTIYPAQPEYMVAQLSEMIRHGVRLIGGCCGTSPTHIHHFRSALRIKVSKSRGHAQYITADPPAEKTVHQKDGQFLEQLGEKRLPVIVELDPPTHLDIRPVLEGAEKLQAAGVDAISIAENPLAVLRTGNLGLAARIKQQTAIPTILHQTGRDMNVLGLQARMMEAHLLGIESILAVSGDSANGSDQPGVSGVFDLRSYGLISMLNGLNNGQNMAGKDLRNVTNFSIGAAFGFRPENPELQIRRLEQKVALGARFVMTQPLFSEDHVMQMVEQTSHIPARIFPGIFPLLSLRNAEFLHYEVPGIHVPAELRTKLAKYESREDQRKAAIDYTHNLIAAIRNQVAGLYLISPLNNWRVVLQLLAELDMVHV